MKQTVSLVRRRHKTILGFGCAIFLVLSQLLSPMVASAAETYQMITKWGSYGGGTSQLDYPENVAVDPGSGNVYVTDSGNNRVQKFDANGAYLGQWGSYGSGNGQFKWPSAAAVDGSGNVYVTDADNHRVQKFNSSGGYLGQWGVPGAGPDAFNFPTGIALDTTGTVYVVDSKNHRVQKFDSSGGYLGQWGSYGPNNGELSYPDGIAIDTSNTVYISDTNNDRVQKFNTNGGYVSQWGGLNYPEGIAVDTSGSVYVADRNAHRIQKFNSSGGLITSWGSAGSADGSFSYPRGVAVDASGNVFVADTLNDRVQKFNLSQFVPPFTTLTLSPAAPDGGGWYKTAVTAQLTRNEAGTTYYQWNSSSAGGWTVYTGAVSAPEGTNTLYYYSKDTDNNSEIVRSLQIKKDTGSPSVSLATPKYSTNQTAGKTFKVSWGGGDSLGRPVQYTVQFRVGAAGSWQAWKTGITATSEDFAGERGVTYYFRALSTDEAGNTSGWSSIKSTIVPRDQTAFKFTGLWSKKLGTSMYEGGANFSSNKGSSAVKKFKSVREVTLIVTKSRSGGYADVYLGSTLVKTVDFYAKTTKHRVPVVIKTYSKPTSGQIKVIVKRTKRPASRGYKVGLDGLALKN